MIIRSPRSGSVLYLVLLVVAFLAVAGFARSAFACCCATCIPAVEAATPPVIQVEEKQHEILHDLITEEFEEWRTWLVDSYFMVHILPALMESTNKISALSMYQIGVIGSFLDAKHQLETQRVFQYMATQAFHDYQPSEGICTIASSIRSLAATESAGKVVSLTLGQRSLDRQLLNSGASTATGDTVNPLPGPMADRMARSNQFRALYCEADDNNRGLAAICGTAPAPQQLRKNKDIDFVRTLGMPSTLDIDLSNNAATPDEVDLLALQSNLYSHDIFLQMPEAKLRQDPTIQKLYMDIRSIIAKRSVAEQSFQAIAGMKARGTVAGAETVKYMLEILKELGIPEAEAQAMLGDSPSYYAQMEVLTKKLFQRPEFFVDLYDNPANVARKSVALQAISLMQRRDLFQSSLRRESILSAIIELDLMKAQEFAENQADPVTERK